jgi:hypothetical protein
MVAVAEAADTSDEVFNANRIDPVWLTIPNASWTPIDNEALTACEPHPRSYYRGAIRLGNEDFPGSGLRIKGGCGSSRTLEDKAAFKANLAWDDPAVEGCPEERRYKGLKKFTFNNQVEDPSFTHERIGYDFYRKLGVPVPRAAPVRMHVNDRLWGLYLNVETVDRRFLARHFESKDGMLYEADYGCDVGNERCFEPKFDTDACDEAREGDPTDMSPLQGLNARLAQISAGDFYPAIDRVLDFDAFLTMWAASAVMGYWDGYPNDANNYRIYHDPTDDRWTVIPTGIDQLFEENVDPFNPVGILAIRCLADAECKAAFKAKLAKVIGIFEAGNYAAMARSIEDQIRADVEADPRKEVTVSEWHRAVSDTVAYIQRRPGELRELLARPEEKQPVIDFRMHVFNEPEGDKFMFATWIEPGSSAGAAPRWLTARGRFSGLSAKADAYELKGGSADGTRVGEVAVNFVNCETAEFQYAPKDREREGLTRRVQVDPGTWKYCD